MANICNGCWTPHGFMVPHGCLGNVVTRVGKRWTAPVPCACNLETGCKQFRPLITPPPVETPAAEAAVPA